MPDRPDRDANRYRVLIASDEPTIVKAWASGYRANGCDVSVGVLNFHLRAARFDLVHLLWPEELTEWRSPSNGDLERIVSLLDAWRRDARIVVTANNLRPHGGEHDEQHYRLYQRVYERATLIQHYSEISSRLVCEEFPAARGRTHVITGPFNYAHLLPYAWQRESARASFSLQPDELCLLVFGAVRFWSELRLLRQGLAKARVPRLRLLMASRWEDWEFPQGWRRRARRLLWIAWLAQEKALRLERYVPDEEVPRLFAAADAVVVPRIRTLNSGVPLLAMTLGRLVIAPKWGSAAEWLAGTRNLLYEPGDPVSLAKAIEKAAVLDREAIGRENQALALRWSWEETAAQCLEASGLRPKPACA